MALTIQGIRIKNLYIGRDGDGEEKVTSNYELVATNDKVLAEKSLSTGKGYGENTFMPSPQTLKLLREAVAAYKKDVEMSLGLDVV